MSCPLFHSYVKKAWVFKPLLSIPSFSDWVFICPINRNYFVFSPFDSTVTEVKLGIGSFANVTFDNGVIMRMNNVFELKVGDEIKNGDIIGSVGPISYAGFDAGLFQEDAEVPIMPNVFGISGNVNISEYIGQEIQNVENDKYSCIDLECTGYGAAVVLVPLKGGYDNEVYRLTPGSSISINPVPNPPSSQNVVFSGWYKDRRYTQEWDNIVPDGLTILFAKWEYSGEYTKNILLKERQSILQPNKIEDVQYKINSYVGNLPFIIDEDESNILGEDIFVISSHIVDTTPLVYTAKQYDLLGVNEGYITYQNPDRYQISPYIMYSKSIEDKSVGIFLSPIGYQICYASAGEKFSQTLYDGDVQWYEENVVESNTCDPANIGRISNITPTKNRSIYVYAYAYGGTPHGGDYIPDIIPILFFMSSRISGGPSIKYFNKYLTK